MAQKGGKREGAGRKALKDKVEPLTLYVTGKVIKGNGGKDKARSKAKEFLIKEAE